MNIGVDIGGSHIGIGIVGANGRILKSKDTYIKRNSGNIGKFIVKEIVTTVNEWSNNIEKVDRIGIAVPGIIIDNKIINSVNLGLANFKLKEVLQRHLGNVKITVQNDAKCAALAEKKYGTLRKYNDCVFMCLGTGIGGAYFVNGRLVAPKRAPGFEFGHMIIKKDGRRCRCGSRGCFEQYASMRRFKTEIKNALNLPAGLEGERLRNAIREKIDEEPVKRIIDEYLDYLCLGISNIINLLEPQAICIGGGFSRYEDILLKRLKQKMLESKDIFYKKHIPNVFVARLGNYAGIVGATLQR